MAQVTLLKAGRLPQDRPSLSPPSSPFLFGQGEDLTSHQRSSGFRLSGSSSRTPIFPWIGFPQRWALCYVTAGAPFHGFFFFRFHQNGPLALHGPYPFPLLPPFFLLFLSTLFYSLTSFFILQWICRSGLPAVDGRYNLLCVR